MAGGDMPFAHLVGIFPRTERVVEVSRAVERRRAGPEELAEAIAEAERLVITVQREAGLDYIVDGQFRWQDLFRPLCDAIPGLHAGGIARWFDNNTFYRRPVITGALQPTGMALLKVINLPALAGLRWKAILPAPFALAAMGENVSGRSAAEVLADAAAVLRAEARALETAGCAYIQFNDPALVARGHDDVGRAREALAAVTVGLRVRTALHTFFADAGPLLTELVRFPVDEVGVDLYAASLNGTTARAPGKTVLAGAVDGRNSLVEDADVLVAQARQLRDRLGAADVALVPNCDMEFLPWDVAVAKTRRLGEAAAALRRAGR
jgi:5-methyltetrahydropteroyltriglutamate--homocysteine methyltransferase